MRGGAAVPMQHPIHPHLEILKERRHNGSRLDALVKRRLQAGRRV